MDKKHFESLYPESAFSEEIERLLGLIRGGRSAQLLGLPGVGRSELLELLAYNRKVREKHLGENSKLVHFVHVDFSEMRGRPLFDVMKFLFLSLTDSLRDRQMLEEYEKVNNSFREALSFKDELVLFQELKQSVDFLALEKKLSLIFLFNRFEEYIPNVGSEFFRNLRVLRDRAKFRFSVIFSSHRPLESVLDPLTLSDYFEYISGNHVFIKFYDKDATEFLISYLEKLTGKSLDKSVREEILKLTGGYAKLTRLSIEMCLANDCEDKDKLKELLFAHKPIEKALKAIWGELTPAEQADVMENKFDDEAIDRYLIEWGLVREKKLQVPLFAEFIKNYKSGIPAEPEKIVYDENTNSIRKGSVVLSDNLTSSEFRLLRYLIQNAERVIERDEIISIVWQGNKSTAGITDQAIDQLIFRVRRKIEEDPNVPKHLQTVKGRGFRFIA